MSKCTHYRRKKTISYALLSVHPPTIALQSILLASIEQRKAGFTVTTAATLRQSESALAFRTNFTEVVE